MHCESGQNYWDFMTDIAAPFVAALSNADDETIEKIRVDVVNSVNERYPDNAVIDTSGVIIYGEK